MVAVIRVEALEQGGYTDAESSFDPVEPEVPVDPVEPEVPVEPDESVEPFVPPEPAAPPAEPPEAAPSEPVCPAPVEVPPLSLEDAGVVDPAHSKTWGRQRSIAPWR